MNTLHARCDMEIREALTFDDVLLVPGASDVLPSTADTRTFGNPIDSDEYPFAEFGNGYRYRGTYGDCHGASGWDWCCSPQSCD